MSIMNKKVHEISKIVKSQMQIIGIKYRTAGSMFKSNTEVSFWHISFYMIQITFH